MPLQWFGNSSYHPCTLRTCCRRVWHPVLCLVLHCTWNNAWVCCRPFMIPQSQVWWEERSPLPHYNLQTLCLGCIPVFHCLGYFNYNSTRVLRRSSILRRFPLAGTPKGGVIKLASRVDLGIVIQLRNGICDWVMNLFYIDNLRSEFFEE